MNSILKKCLLCSLITFLFVMSNLFGIQYITFGGLSISCKFLAYPFVVLCLLLLWDSFGKKWSFSAIMSISFVVIVSLVVFRIIINLADMNLLISKYSGFIDVFKISEIKSLIVFLTFILTSFGLITLSDYFKRIGSRFIGVSLGCLMNIILYGIIYTITFNYNSSYLLYLLVSELIISLLMGILIILLYYVFREKYDLYQDDNLFIKELDIDIYSDFTEDKNIVDIMEIYDEKRIAANKKRKLKKKNGVNKSKKSVKE